MVEVYPYIFTDRRPFNPGLVIYLKLEQGDAASDRWILEEEETEFLSLAVRVEQSLPWPPRIQEGALSLCDDDCASCLLHFTPLHSQIRTETCSSPSLYISGNDVFEVS